MILQVSYIYYLSYWLPHKAHFHTLEKILCSYLWAKYGGAWGVFMVPYDVFIMTKVEGGLGLIDIVT